MRRKRKPALAATRTRVINTKQTYHTPAPIQFQCPRCMLAGNAELFQPGWPERLHELIARNSGMGWQELLGLYKGLCKHGRKKK